MADKYTESLFEIADVTGSTVAANGEIRVNLGDGGTGAGIDADVSILGSYGFSARPPSPDAGGAAQAFFVRDGNVRRVLATRDRRWLASSLGQRDEGDVAVWTKSGVRILLDDSVPGIELVAVQTPGSCRATLGASSFDVTGSNTVAEPVALYAALQAVEFAIGAYLVAANPLLVKIPAPPTPLELSVLATAFTNLTAALNNAVNPALAASQVLRASPI